MFLGIPSIHAFVGREVDDALPMPQRRVPTSAELQDPEVRDAVITYFAEHAAFYESFLVFGARPDDIRSIFARGFTPRWQQGSFLMAEFRGCPVSLSVAKTGEAGKLVVAHAMWPLRQPVWVNEIPVQPEEPITMKLDKIGCGDVWISAVFADLQGKLRICKGSTPDGRLQIRAAEAPTELPCEMVAIPPPPPPR